MGKKRVTEGLSIKIVQGLIVAFIGVVAKQLIFDPLVHRLLPDGDWALNAVTPPILWLASPAADLWFAAAVMLGLTWLVLRSPGFIENLVFCGPCLASVIVGITYRLLSDQPVVTTADRRSDPAMWLLVSGPLVSLLLGCLGGLWRRVADRLEDNDLMWVLEQHTGKRWTAFGPPTVCICSPEDGHKPGDVRVHAWELMEASKRGFMTRFLGSDLLPYEPEPEARQPL